ncbi:MAG: DNA-binding protein [Firmicutes bacterium]|nr:DNA-binding protein [Bacillota bacterium]
MKYSEARQGRVFILRLEDGDVLHEAVEQFAQEKGIGAAAVIAVGGADVGSKIVVGPEEGRSQPIAPMEFTLPDVYEVSGTGTIFPDNEGKPVLHMHAAFGRNETAHAGCVRAGVKTWHVLEVIILEIVNTTAKRLPDPVTGFKLLIP